MTGVLLIKALHILSGAILFGTGLGIAFFMLMAHRTRDPRIQAAVGRMVVIADMAFTASAVLIQPVTGLILVRSEGFSLTESWLEASYVLYLLVGACWLPVVWVQWKMTRLARDAAEAGEGLPATYDRLFRIWFLLGWPAFAGVVAIYVLMVTKPVLWVAQTLTGG